VIRDSIEHRSGRTLPRDERRLELALRARSMALRRRGGSVGRCPSCGRPVSNDERWLSVGALVVHPDCLFG
jgi:hypothetical protein